MSKPFKIRVLDEDICTHGFWVEVTGIDLTQFAKNPVILKEHYWGQVVGRGEKVWVEKTATGNELWAEILFDMDDPAAAELAGKVERNFIRMASAGLIPLEWSELKEDIKPGQSRMTVKKSKLREISIVVFGANENAFVQLYSNDNTVINMSAGSNTEIPALTQQQKQEVTMELSEFARRVDLRADAAEGDVLLAITNMKAARDKAEEALAALKTTKEKADKELTALKLHAEKTAKELAVLTAEKETAEKKAATDKAKNLVTLHVQRGAIMEAQRELYEELAAKDYEKAEAQLKALPDRPKFYVAGSKHEVEMSAIDRELQLMLDEENKKK